MLNIGCHLSSSKGYLAMGQQATAIGATTFQFFTRNPRGSSAKELDLEDIKRYSEYARANGIGEIVAHAPYTFNLCSADASIRDYSLRTMMEDLANLEHVPGALYNFHPGSHVKQGVDIGTEFIVTALNVLLENNYKTPILLETMAGKGSEMGRTFAEIATIINASNHPERLFVCLDTCHLHDGGYSVATDFDSVMQEFDQTIGIDRLRAIHLNDSKNICGSHKDRHAKIGEGEIGEAALVEVINHPLIKNLPFVLETPNELPGYADEIKRLKAAYR